MLPATIAVMPIAVMPITMPVAIPVDAVTASAPAAAIPVADQAHLLGLNTIHFDGAELVDRKRRGRSSKANRKRGGGQRQFDDVHEQTPGDRAETRRTDKSSSSSAHRVLLSWSQRWWSTSRLCRVISGTCR